MANVEEEQESNFYTGMGGAGTGDEGQTLNELDAKHDYYADELEKIKAMLN